MKNGRIHWLMYLMTWVRVLSGCQDSLVGCESFQSIGGVFLRLLLGITLKFGRNLSFHDVKIDLKDRLFKED